MVENFHKICQFCLEATKSLRRIFDNSTDETTADSYDFLKILDSVLNQNGSNFIDCKLTNLVCEKCFDLIENLNTFKVIHLSDYSLGGIILLIYIKFYYKIKKQCEKSASLLQEAKVTLEAKISSYDEKPGNEALPLKNNVSNC